MRELLVCVFFIGLAACNQKAWIDRLASSQEQQLAIQTAQDFRDGNVGAVSKYTEPDLAAQLPRAASEVKPILARTRGPFTIETVNVSEVNGGPITKVFTLQTGSGSSWAIAEVVFRRTPQSLQLAGFHVAPANSNPSKLNDFSISERGLLGYIWLFLMFTCVAICLVAVAIIWRRPWLGRRWLWTLGSLVGFSGFALNWSTGAWTILINVSLLGAGATKGGPYSPWVLTFGIPVVAIIVIVRFLRGRQTQIVHSTDEV